MFDFQRPNPGDGWTEAQHDAAPLPAGDYLLQAKFGEVHYAIAAAAPTTSDSYVTLVPLEKAPIRLEAGDKLFVRVQRAGAEVHILK